MDELTELMATSGDISSSTGSTQSLSFRSTQYKVKSGFDQRKRRDKLLELQKRHRKEVVNQLRQIDDEDWHVFSSSVVQDDSMESEETDSSVHKYANEDLTRYKDRLMLSEWMIEVPCDLESQWIMVPSPVGRRCLVVAKNGVTCMYIKSGYCLKRFPSKLPGGCRYTRGQGSRAGVTLLDCIFDELKKTFFVLDIICWNGHPVIDSETEFRLFWLKSKLIENPESGRVSKVNPYIFCQLPSFECKKDILQNAMSEDFGFKLDGLLFYHRCAHYLCGSTPLVVWLKPYMIPEVLGIDVNRGYIEDAPPSYAGYETHLHLVQSHVSITQKHQDLYTTPNGKPSKAQTIAEHQAMSNASNEAKPLVQKAKFTNTQSAVRDLQLGIRADNSNVGSKTGTTSFKFGDAPSLSLEYSSNRAPVLAASMEDAHSNFTYMGDSNLSEASISHLSTDDKLSPAVDNEVTLPQTLGVVTQLANEWSQYR